MVLPERRQGNVEKRKRGIRKAGLNKTRLLKAGLSEKNIQYRISKINMPKRSLLKTKPMKNSSPGLRLPDLKWTSRLLLYVVTLILSVLSIMMVCFDTVNTVLSSIVYTLVAVAFALSGYYLYYDLKYGVNKKIKAGIERNPFTNRMAKDYRYRTVLFTYSSLAVNMVFALFNGVFGIMNQSVWFGALSAYYIVLSIMRFIVVQYERRSLKAQKTQELKRKDWSVYQNCGILFIILSIVLGAAVIQMVYSDKAHSYPGTLIFGVAAYTFYKIIVSVMNVVKAGRLKAPLLMTIRHIGYADAVVSMLSLQTAMFVSFGSEDAAIQQKMNGLTGGGVCLMIFTTGIYMIYSAQRQKEKL